MPDGHHQEANFCSQQQPYDETKPDAGAIVSLHALQPIDQNRRRNDESDDEYCHRDIERNEPPTPTVPRRNGLATPLYMLFVGPTCFSHALSENASHGASPMGPNS